MLNDYAVHHARRLHNAGATLDEIDDYLRVLATRNERREIIATLNTTEPMALAA